MHYFFELLGSVRDLRYADLGAALPAGHSNTYLFYTLGGSGVLVEADPTYGPSYRQMRPRDRVEQVAIVPKRLSGQGAVQFHTMQNSGWNTASVEHVELGVSLGKGPVRQTFAVPCVTINELLEKHFPDGQLDILSMDLEGLDGEVLGELNIARFRPKMIIVESLDAGELGGLGRLSTPLLCPQGYQLFASTFVNSIFVDSNCLKSIRV